MVFVGGGDDEDALDRAREAGSSENGFNDLVAFVTLLAMHRIAVDPAQLQHELGHRDNVGAPDLLRLAKRNPDMRARRVISSVEKLATLPLPALARDPMAGF